METTKNEAIEGKERTMCPPGGDLKCLVLAEGGSDFTGVLESCGARITRMTMEEAVGIDLSPYGAYCVLACGKILDPRLRIRLEEELRKGKRLFTEALNSWDGIYSAGPADTTRRRLVVLDDPEDGGIPGLAAGDLLDDMSNRMMQPWYGVPGLRPIVVYREQVIAHRHWNASREEIMKDAGLGLWTIGGNVMMCSFEIHNFNRARFSPRASWQCLIRFIARWITGAEPSRFPAPVVRHRDGAELADEDGFERCRCDAVELWAKDNAKGEGGDGTAESHPFVESVNDEYECGRGQNGVFDVTHLIENQSPENGAEQPHHRSKDERGEDVAENGTKLHMPRLDGLHQSQSQNDAEHVADGSFKDEHDGRFLRPTHLPHDRDDHC